MKKIFTVAALLFISSLLYGGKIVEGYYINFKGDTIFGTIKVPSTIWGSLSDEAMQWKIKYKMPSGKFKKLRSFEIKGYGFTYNSMKYVYETNMNSLPTGLKLFSNTSDIMLRVRIKGYLTMYEYFVNRTYGSGGGAGGTMVMVTVTLDKVCYKKGNGGLVTIRAINFKKQMSEFLSDYPQLSKDIQNKVYRADDQERIVDLYNKWYNSK